MVFHILKSYSRHFLVFSNPIWYKMYIFMIFLKELVYKPGEYLISFHKIEQTTDGFY